RLASPNNGDAVEGPAAIAAGCFIDVEPESAGPAHLYPGRGRETDGRPTAGLATGSPAVESNARPAGPGTDGRVNPHRARHFEPADRGDRRAKPVCITRERRRDSPGRYGGTGGG